ncbi:hypothetical protein J7T55_011746 [Diaporthe amygdali]|uniref:uncharacterized protein n=1 Tax=Phomopsis amygdali TaxID=1214568 RepID=UPI0022FF2EE3|nr:uncharacterized protein J7T55_011746 [Diaporthe amygdali]KAJ0123281.1 hypothetical protein J7T55_011746 [Diaporthe amygdali]
MWRRRYKQKAEQSLTDDNKPSAGSSESSPPVITPIADRTRKPSDPGFCRRDSVASNLSDVPGPLLGLSVPPHIQRKRSQDRRNDPLGISVLHEPDIPRKVDVLFIHGLGGTSIRSWCKSRDPEFLWPKLWLPYEPGLSSARILTFGYNAHFASTKGSSSQTIGDFATDLLFRMKYGDAETESLGDAPIIVVAHSMGGLVFKRAFIQGSLNKEYQGIIKNIRAVLFLATPHRGSDLAETLNRILSSSIFGHSSKDYLTELTRNSVTIDELNESFRHHASKMRIFSFYETLVTSVGPRNMMILDKSSSLLGYPNETAQPLNANHHDVCKFTDVEDPNYISVRGAMRSVVGSIIASSPGPTEEAFEDSIEDIREYLAVGVTPADDATALRVLRKEGTCEEFLTQKDFKQWTEADKSCILWQNIADIRQVALEEMDYLVSDESFKESTVAEIARRSNGNFLWASLVIKRVLRCHRSEDVERVLDTTPDGMDQLYLRMCEAVSTLEFEEDIALSRLLLGWATYAKRPLTVDELKEAYPTELGTIMDLRNTASQVGGQFITIDSNGQLVLVHHTAREYLRNRNLRTRINQKRPPHFLEYAATAWAFHLDHIPIESDKALEIILRFFRGPYTLPWIQYLAGVNKLVEVVKAAKSLTTFAQKRRKFDADQSPLLHRISDLEYLGSCRAMHVAVSDQYLAVGDDSPAGNITIWRRMIFQRESSKYTYIWQVETGTLIVECPNPHRARAVAMSFGPKDSSLMVATDLRKVHRLMLNDKSSAWVDTDPALLEEVNIGEGAFLNAPSAVAFNSDNTQLAIGYRGFPLSVWNIDPPEMVGRIRRRLKVDEVRAVDVDANATPSEIKCSPNGLVFATGDVKGSVKIYDFYGLALIYKLTSEDIIQGLCFSPDSRVFYDLRGLYCNVWEPNCLVRLIDDRALDDSDSSGYSGCDDVWSDTEDARSTNFSFAASEAHAGGKPAITTIAANPSLRLIIYGNEDGTVEIYDMDLDFKHVVAKSTFAMGVVQVAWGPTDNHIAYVTWNGRVTVKKITVDREAKSPKLAVKQTQVFSEKAAAKRGAPKQILFNQTGELLLISAREKTQILHISTGQIVTEILTPHTHGVWERHPVDGQLLIYMTCSGLHVFAWSNLDHKHEILIDSDPSALAQSQAQLQQIFSSRDHDKLLMVINNSTSERSWKKTLSVLDLSILRAQTAGDGVQIIKPHSITPALLEIVEQVVGLLPDGRMIFLDEDLWVCTAHINGGGDVVTRHFFIPRDWVNAAGLALCQVLPDGTLLCPCKGELAVIRSDLASLW